MKTTHGYDSKEVLKRQDAKMKKHAEKGEFDLIPNMFVGMDTPVRVRHDEEN